MSDFTGINNFGSLTTNTGKVLKFEDFDVNKDGQITQEEYESVMKEMQLDTVELSTVDKNNDKSISEEEFAVWEQKIEMQNFVNDKQKQITTDFTGTKSEHIPQIMSELRDYINDFAKNFDGEVSTMAESFKAAFDKKYAEIKENVLKNDPATIKSNVIESVYVELITPEAQAKGADGTTVSSESIPETAAKRIAKELEAEADKFIKNYKGNNLEEDLRAHLNEFMNASDATKLASVAETFNDKANTYGSLIDSNELKSLKEDAKEFLQTALDKGVTIKLGGVTIKTTAAITSALNKFTDGEELVSALNEAIQNLNTLTKKEQIIAEENAKATLEANKTFSGIKGSSYAIDATVIDYSNITGYAENDKLTTKGKKNHDEKLRNQAKEIIQNGNLKEQFKAQITKMLEKQGVPFEKIETVFENIYNNSLSQTLEGITSKKTNHRWLNKNKMYKTNQGIQEIIQNFITNFNTNITKAIDEMNASDKDMDLYDIDFTQAGKDENGNPLTVDGEDISTLYANRKVLTKTGNGPEYYQDVAETMVENMRPQMRAKAKAMCEANGVTFDESVFTAMFNNVKLTAVEAAITGKSGRGCVRKAGVAVGGSIGGAVGGAVAGFGGTIGIIASGLSVAGPIGWIVGGVLGLGAVLASIFRKGDASSCTLDTGKLLDTMAQEFKTNYTAWVEKEKANAK